MSINHRKEDHLNLTLSGQAGYKKSSGFELYDFVHNALPEMAPVDADPSVTLLGRRFPSPVFISSMTGGMERGRQINAEIALFCQKNDIPFGLGSMRPMLEDPSVADSFRVARDLAPDAFIAANIGGTQAAQISDKDLRFLVETIAADALIVHLNPLQELMQSEGDRQFGGVATGIKRVVEQSPVPVIVKETGAGISGAVAYRLYHECGVRCIDIAGAGGTSWGKVENTRKATPDMFDALFDDWGIPTVHCLTDIRTQYLPDLELIASGGIRNPHDVLKSLCMGAKSTAFAGAVISIAAHTGAEGLQQWYDSMLRALRTTMCLLGTRTTNDLGMQLLRRI